MDALRSLGLDRQMTSSGPAEYAPACGRVARVQIGKAGKRLAEMLEELLKPKQNGANAFEG